MISVARAFALVSGDNEVRWHHIKRMVKPVLRHRISLSSKALRSEAREDDIIDSLISLIEENIAYKRVVMDTVSILVPEIDVFLKIADSD